MKDWPMLVGVIILVVVLPVVALTGSFGSTAKLIGRILLGILATLGMIGTGLFGYICIRAQARKWGAGLFVITALCVVALYWLIMQQLPFI